MGVTRQPSTSSALRIVAAAIGLVLAVGALVVFRKLFLAVVAGVLGGTLLAPLIARLQHWLRLPHRAGVAVAVLLLLVCLAGAGWAVYAAVAEQAWSLIGRAPEILATVADQLDQWVSRLDWLGVSPGDLAIGEWLQGTVMAVLSGARVSLHALIGGLAILMIAIFVGSNAETYLRGFLTAFPPARRGRVEQLARGSAAVVRRWLGGQFLVASISGVLTGIALWLIGSDYWLLLAFLTVVLDFIPFLGAVITALLAVVLTLGTEPDKVWWVLLAYVAIQQVESDVTLPIVMKERVRLPEAHLLVFLLLMSAAFGAIGAFVAAPVFAVLHHLYRSAYVPWVESR